MTAEFSLLTWVELTEFRSVIFPFTSAIPVPPIPDSPPLNELGEPQEVIKEISTINSDDLITNAKLPKLKTPNSFC